MFRDGTGGHGGEGGALLFCRSKKRASKQIGKPWTDLFVKRRAGGGELVRLGGWLFGSFLRQKKEQDTIPLDSCRGSSVLTMTLSLPH